MVLKKTAEAIKTISQCLLNSGIAIIPCDTIYGFVSVTDEGESKIRSIKGRDENKPFIRLIASPDYLEAVTYDSIDSRILSLWPGPLTLVVNSVNGGTTAVRVPQDSFLRQILDICARPMVSTSVNRSGMPALNRISEIVREFGRQTDIIVDGGDLENPLPSTILDITVNPYKIIRQGQCVVPENLLGKQL